MTPLTYLSMDSVQEGVGASQVLPYLERMAARGIYVRLHSFEWVQPSDDLVAEVGAAGIEWTAHRSGSHGSAGGLGRVMRAAAALRGADLVHARADLAAASALLGHPGAWLWDVRSLWADQRIAAGTLRAGSPQERVVRRVESAAAARASVIVTLTRSAVDVLAQRHGPSVLGKARVVPTCVDLERFRGSPFPCRPVRLLLSGSFNPLYDMELMLRFSQLMAERTPTRLTMLRPHASPWDGAVIQAGGEVRTVAFANMHAEIARHHAGLSILRADAPLASIAAMPTKIAELLASGRPVVVNAGLGDAVELFGATRTGVVLQDRTPESLKQAADEVLRLLEDPSTPSRCRDVAEQHFDLERGVDILIEAYRSMVVGSLDGAYGHACRGVGRTG